MMFLAIDIGNTEIVLGLFRGKRLQQMFRISTVLQKTADEYGLLLKNILRSWAIPPSDVNSVMISSVVPVLTAVFEEASANCFKIRPILVTSSLSTGITLAYPRPEEIGADRIVNAAAAMHLFGHEGLPMLIIDFGTATTFDLVDQGVYYGGAIAPGLGISAEALSSRTAKLPKVDWVVPQNVIGRDTVSSIQSGLIFGHVGLVHEMIARMTQELPNLLKKKRPHPSLKVIATGGLAPFLAPLCRNVTIVRPTLTLEGLMVIYHKYRAEEENARKVKHGYRAKRFTRRDSRRRGK